MTTAKKALASRGIEDILAVARPREAEVRLCLAGDLAADADRLDAELIRVGAGWVRSSLGDVDPTVAVRAELDKVHARMRAAEVVFRFRALPRLAYSDLLAEHPPREGKEKTETWNPETFPIALIAASCIDPVMTLEQADRLYSVVNDAARGELFSAAWRAHSGATQVPTTRAASPNPSS